MNESVAINLRPASLGELLDQGIALYRRNFATFVGIFAVVMVPLILAQILFSLLTFGGLINQLQDPAAMTDPTALFTPGYAIGMLGNSAVVILNFILVQGLATAALTRAIGDSYLGQPVTIGGAYRRIGSSWLNLLGALLLAVLLVILLLAWTLIPCVGWLTGPGMLAFVGLAIMPLLAPAIILERQPVGQAFHRVWDLTRRRFWPVVVYVIILSLFAQFVVTGPTLVVTFVFQFLVGNPFNTLMGMVEPPLFVLQTIAESLTTLVVSLVFLPLQASCIMLLYFDLRIRTEGFDLDVKLRQRQADDLDILFAAAPRPTRPIQPQQEEWVYFSSLTLGTVLVFGLLFSLFFGLVVLLASTMTPLL
jgi:hypothetical protein